MLRLPHCALLCICMALLAGCAQVPYSEGYPATKTWTVLPAINRSVEPTAGKITTQLIYDLLPSIGVANRQLAPAKDSSGSSQFLSETHQQASARHWAKQQHSPLALSAIINQWEIQDSRAVLDITLIIEDPETGAQLWQTQATSHGAIGESENVVAHKLIKMMLSSIPLQPKN